ncbi:MULTISPECIES: rod shape-determining protein MreD [Vibrio]|jgi:rod shape-determining protein MreD|uniref:Rod shape-determining protein MreD n=1 Tax=Vibrio coralliilyticus TaxID=190893 RepID=A0AAJ3F157_9VIBR|nr:MULTISPECIES: rod shape-determining protein MreD [Vibrio]AIW19988.1 rod shape-determining protein MreD [Vibrio coralliilyticus]ANW24666.1 rod shape-determining protein MreD [Vibrio coralliilyticus]ARC93191.1 rod shape-determining protein MreD [Vibrio coralliilyticus]AXN31659.1 rod shape-determining protein MreD [Vibrio coralliilyticus]EEX34928.1 rod shape-determining protein MreD [Vibrio coralliilyticus ATCC BAA-450]
MANSVFKGKMVIAFSFLIALTLQTIPWPGVLDVLRPSWLFLVVCYWVLALPHRVNVGTALILGLLWDLLLGSTLGIRGMMMSIVVYLVALNFLVLRNMALWQQAMLIGLLSIVLDVLIFSGEYLIQDITFNLLSLWSGLINCILWPWLFLLMRRVRRHWHVR